MWNTRFGKEAAHSKWWTPSTIFLFYFFPDTYHYLKLHCSWIHLLIYCLFSPTRMWAAWKHEFICLAHHMDSTREKVLGTEWTKGNKEWVFQCTFPKLLNLKLRKTSVIISKGWILQRKLKGYWYPCFLLGRKAVKIMKTTGRKRQVES